MISSPEVLTRLSGRKILVIEDEKYAQHIIMRILSPLEVVVVPDGALGLLQLKQDPRVVMVICDFNMPLMDGLSFLKAVRCGVDDISRDLPVVMLTASNDAGLLRQALALDADGFLVKPVRAEDIQSQLEKLLLNPQPLKTVEQYREVDVDSTALELLGHGSTIDPCVGNGAVSPQPLAGQRVSLHAVPPQSILAEDVCAPSGDVLVEGGTQISERLIARLVDLAHKNLGPAHVWVY